MPAALSRLLRPESIAIVGLSADPTKHGQRVLTFLRRFGYQKPVWGVNPNTPEVPGAEVFPRLRDLSRAPDAIVLAIPPPAIPGVLEEAGEVGAGGAILFSGGFAEAGKEGASLQARIRDIARCARCSASPSSWASSPVDPVRALGTVHTAKPCHVPVTTSTTIPVDSSSTFESPTSVKPASVNRIPVSGRDATPALQPPADSS